MNIASLSQELNISVTELRRRMSEAGFRISARARKVDNVLAREILDKLKPKPKITGPATSAVKTITIPSVISVRDFAVSLGLPASAVIKSLITNGVMASLNEQIDYDAAAVVAHELGFIAEQAREGASGAETVADVLARQNSENLKPRPPIVAVMGHVDHGKTKLLDTIRSTNVIDTEAGAITQHIGAYRVLYKEKWITFLDTPGHEAFAAMRARGANVTDIIILVVAADDGVKQQTLEVINRAKLTKTPMIVAVNKIDKAEANPELVKKQLAEAGVAPEEWGGNTIFVPISAKQNLGVDKLLDMILLTAEVAEFKADPSGEIVGTVIESRLSKTQGPTASVIIQSGTLAVGSIVSVGAGYGRVRILHDEHRRNLKTAGPSTPVRISGLSEVPGVGDLLRVYPDLRTAEAVARQALLSRKAKHLAAKSGIAADVENQQLNLIIKADMQGSLEAITQELNKLENKDVKIKIISAGVGDINESDVLNAESAHANIVGFHNNVSPAAARLVKQKKVNIAVYDIIYELTEEVTQAILKMVLPEVEILVVGRAKILAVFMTEKNETIVGGVVTEGEIARDRKVAIERGEGKIGEGKIEELQHNKLPIPKVKKGEEFGVKISTKAKLAKGDYIAVQEERIKEKKLKTVST